MGLAQSLSPFVCLPRRMPLLSNNHRARKYRLQTHMINYLAAMLAGDAVWVSSHQGLLSGSCLTVLESFDDAVPVGLYKGYLGQDPPPNPHSSPNVTRRPSLPFPLLEEDQHVFGFVVRVRNPRTTYFSKIAVMKTTIHSMPRGVYQSQRHEKCLFFRPCLISPQTIAADWMHEGDGLFECILHFFWFGIHVCVFGKEKDSLVRAVWGTYHTQTPPSTPVTTLLNKHTANTLNSTKIQSILSLLCLGPLFAFLLTSR